MRVLVADSNRDVRSALGVLLAERVLPGSVDEASSANELEERTRQKPDLLIIDWALASTGLGRILNRFRLGNPLVTVIVLSSSPETRRSALQAGADYFVNKAEPPGQLLQILHGLRAMDAGGPAT